MICPHCGSDQPIAEMCAQCGGNLLHAAPAKITIIEEIATNRWVKTFFALSLLVALFGAYFLVRGYRQQSAGQFEPEPAEVVDSPAPAGTDQTAARGILPQAPLSVAFVAKLGEYDPQLIRTFEEVFRGTVDEIVINQPQALEVMRKTKPDFWITLGQGAENFVGKNAATIPGLAPAWHLSLTEKLTAKDVKRPKFFALSTRPAAAKVMLYCKEVFQGRSGKILVLADPSFDEEYTDALYAAALEQGLALDLLEVRNTQGLKKLLETLPKDFMALLIIESPAFLTPEAQASLGRYVAKMHKPIVAVGSTLGKAGGIAELKADLTTYAQDLPQILDKLHDGSLPSTAQPWLSSSKVLVTFYSRNAQAIALNQLEQLSRLIENRNPEFTLAVVR